MVWIHGGGYGTGQGNNEFWELLQTNDNGFVLVLIQYRLGAFGWLSSDDLVNNGGVPNAGLHDMHFALQWVKQHIGQFGGDSDHVTISGESAGAGAVMLLGMTNNGSEGTSLFTNSIAASPYLPTQWRYDGLAPTQAYDNFATEVGCTDDSQNSSIFACLVGADTLTLQNASAIISGSYKYGQWAFLPVTDTNFLSERPSVQLNAGQVNGLRLLTSNNADEGQGFVPQNITSESDFNEYVEGLFPLMSRNNITRILEAYSIALVKPGPLFSTLGDSGPTALNQSEFAIGQQQRANNLYAETTFVCPSYWLANGYMASKWPGKTGTSQKRAAWKYQFSVPPSEHGADLDAYQAFNREALGEGTMTTAARLAIQLAWGRFIMYDNPTLPDSIILDLVTGTNGISTHDNITAISSSNWPQWSSEPPLGQSLMLNVNMTGGMPHVITWTPVGGTAINITQMTAPGLEAAFRIVDANSWEAGRAQRCEVWRELGDVVPE
ncbi:Alpha/Beta hydrolase protein [Coniella lustricola]|uniref:Carboxylic ester hydrolase n=1 Tax=Coniella lustricola TaxID=2025994 RepID=A0A2T3A7Z5_9PEZI|nr:Alpha/Beta hydrolase protein [Coniella lustricola]